MEAVFDAPKVFGAQWEVFGGDVKRRRENAGNDCLDEMLFRGEEQAAQARLLFSKLQHFQLLLIRSHKVISSAIECENPYRFKRVSRSIYRLLWVVHLLKSSPIETVLHLKGCHLVKTCKPSATSENQT